MSSKGLDTIIVLPLTSKSKPWPTRVDVMFDSVPGQIVCEQIRTVSKECFSRQLGKLALSEMVQVKLVLKQMFFDER